MNIITSVWLKQHPKVQQWLWFVALWVGGLLTVTILTYPLKWLMR